MSVQPNCLTGASLRIGGEHPISRTFREQTGAKFN
jgi:hypothetical protein